MKLTTNQIIILEQAKIEDNKLYLQWQLDRKEYKAINDVLETIGLKRSRKDKAHVADCTADELQEAIEDIIETWEVETLKETIKKFQFYETPIEVAEYLVSLSNIQEDDYVCEPSAWHWAIADCIPKEVIDTLHLYEIDKKKCDILQQKWYKVHNIDWLEHNNMSFDKIIANPPFSKSQDVKHILKMYETLSEWWRLVSVASASIKTRQGKLYDELRELNPEYVELPSGSFRESGTMVGTVIVIINKW